MKKRYVLGIIVFIIILGFLFIPSVPSTQSHDGSIYSFNYPSTWEISKSNVTQGSSISLFQKNGSRDATILIVDTYDGATLNDASKNYVDLFSSAYPDDFNDTLVPYPQYKLLINKTVNVNGLSGVDLLFRTSEMGEISDPPVFVEIVLLQKGDKFYKVMMQYKRNITNPYAHDDLMVIVNSLKIK